jgi:hypothetical protein
MLELHRHYSGTFVSSSIRILEDISDAIWVKWGCFENLEDIYDAICVFEGVFLADLSK